MDTHAAAANLISVKNDVVCFCANLSRICVKKRKILLHKHGERMVHCCKTILLLAPLKKRELCYPYETILIFV